MFSLLTSQLVMVASVCLQMLDRYVQHSADNAHPSSEDSSSTSNNGSQADSASASEEAASEADENTSAAADGSAHLAGLSVNDSAVDNDTSSNDNNLSHSPADLDHQHRVTAEPGVDPEPQMAPSDRHGDSEALPEQLPVDLPDHVAIRANSNGPRAVSRNEAEADLDDSSVMSHSTQIPSQAAVKQRVLEQQRSRMRRQVLARASRNAQKVGNKKERKQTADSVNW